MERTLRRENPDAAPERLEEFYLKLTIGHRVGEVLQNAEAKVGYLFQASAQCLLFGRFIVKAVQKE